MESTGNYKAPSIWNQFFLEEGKDPDWDPQYGSCTLTSQRGLCVRSYKIIKPYESPCIFHREHAISFIFTQSHGAITLTNLSSSRKPTVLAQSGVFPVGVMEGLPAHVYIPPYTAYQLYLGVGVVMVSTAHICAEGLKADTHPFKLPEQALAA